MKSQVWYSGTACLALFDAFLGVRVRQGESLSPLVCNQEGVRGVTVRDLRLWLLLYADDSILIANSIADPRDGLHHVHDYCQR